MVAFCPAESTVSHPFFAAPFHLAVALLAIDPNAPERNPFTDAILAGWQAGALTVVSRPNGEEARVVFDNLQATPPILNTCIVGPFLLKPIDIALISIVNTNGPGSSKGDREDE